MNKMMQMHRTELLAQGSQCYGQSTKWKASNQELMMVDGPRARLTRGVKK